MLFLREYFVVSKYGFVILNLIQRFRDAESPDCYRDG